jgi:hypothetical protein
MSEISALLPPNPPPVSAAVNIMAFQMQRRTQASAAVAAVRAAAGEDPRAALRLAHAELTAVDGDIAELTDTLDRARQHLDATTDRLRATEANARAAETAAATGMIAAFVAGASSVTTLDGGEAAKSLTQKPGA